MKQALVVVLAAGAVSPTQAVAHSTGGRTAQSTGYCLTGKMADGSFTRAGSVAMNGVRLGTRITVSASPTGRRRFVVRDRIGFGSQLDFWTSSCGQAIRWGRRTVRWRYGW